MIDAANLESVLSAISGASRYNSWGDVWDHWTYQMNRQPFTVPGVGTIEVIDVHELGEGDWGGETYIVFQVTDERGNKTLFKKDGHYQSFEGTEWDGGFRVVEQVKKYTTVYE